MSRSAITTRYLIGDVYIVFTNTMPLDYQELPLDVKRLIVDNLRQYNYSKGRAPMNVTHDVEYERPTGGITDPRSWPFHGDRRYLIERGQIPQIYLHEGDIVYRICNYALTETEEYEGNGRWGMGYSDNHYEMFDRSLRPLDQR